MKLITKKQLEQLPKLYASESTQLDDKKVWIKYFTPDSSYTWYVIEGEVTQNREDLTLFFGLVDSGTDRELGYFTLKQLLEVRGKLGLPVERDLSFKPKLIKDL